MSNKTKLIIAILFAIGSLTVVTALANTIVFPVVYNNYPTATPVPTPTPIPQPDILIIDFNASASATNDYVELFNSSSNTVDLTGWWVKADSGERYDFPSGFTLGGGELVRVRSGSGSNTSSDLYWGLSYPLWVDLGNCAYVKNADGVTVDSACVPPVYIAGFNPSLNPQNDYVEIKNNTTYSIDLTGWWLKAETESGRYDFPVGFTLGALRTVRVRSGFGNNSSSDLYIGLPYSLWTVSGNCAYLRYKDGTLLDKSCVP